MNHSFDLRSVEKGTLRRRGPHPMESSGGTESLQYALPARGDGCHYRHPERLRERQDVNHHALARRLVHHVEAHYQACFQLL